jgi:hypothetical protein
VLGAIELPDFLCAVSFHTASDPLPTIVFSTANDGRFPKPAVPSEPPCSPVDFWFPTTGASIPVIRGSRSASKTLSIYDAVARLRTGECEPLMPCHGWSLACLANRK